MHCRPRRSSLNDNEIASQFSVLESRSETNGILACMTRPAKEDLPHGTSHKRRRKQEDTRRKSTDDPKTYLANSNAVGHVIAHVDSLFPPQTMDASGLYPPELSERDLVVQDDSGIGSDSSLVSSSGSEWDDCDLSLKKTQKTSPSI